MQGKKWTDIPPDVHEAIRHARWWLFRVAESIKKDEYADELNRIGLALDCDFEAGNLDDLLSDYGLPSEYQPGWLNDPETMLEATERFMMKDCHSKK